MSARHRGPQDGCKAADGGSVSNAAPRTLSSKPQLSVCICSYRRPSVANTISSILDQQDVPVAIELLVVDDDPDCSAHDMVQALAQGSSIPIRYVWSGAGNIAAARNSCLLAARADWMAFIDDDEIADPRWVAELWAAHLRYPSMAIKGNVRGHYPPDTPAWIKSGDPFASYCGATGAEVKLGATGNVLIHREAVIQEGVWFNPIMGRTGGEDLDFFNTLIERGYRMVACETATVYEIAVKERISPKALSRRYRRHAHIDCRILVVNRPLHSRLRVVVQAAALAIACSTYVVCVHGLGRVAFRLFGRFWYSVGILEWVIGAADLRHE